MDKFRFKQLMIAIVVVFGLLIISGQVLASCVSVSTVTVTDCYRNTPCSTIKVKFHNMQNLPKDTLNATALKIIQGINRGTND